MRYRQIALVALLAYLVILSAGLQAQTKPVAKSITVYQDPG
jgi:hypothetical protein